MWPVQKGKCPNQTHTTIGAYYRGSHNLHFSIKDLNKYSSPLLRPAFCSATSSATSLATSSATCSAPSSTRLCPEGQGLAATHTGVLGRALPGSPQALLLLCSSHTCETLGALRWIRNKAVTGNKTITRERGEGKAQGLGGNHV